MLWFIQAIEKTCLKVKKLKLDTAHPQQTSFIYLDILIKSICVQSWPEVDNVLKAP